MGKIKLQPGDLFGSRNPMVLGRAINGMQSFVSRDGKSEFSHSGIIVDSKGTTFEALWKLKTQNFFEAYEESSVIIARWVGMPKLKIPGITIKTFSSVYLKLTSEHMKQMYPGWRLFLHVIPPIAKLVSWKGKYVVCSELVAKFLYLCHLEMKEPKIDGCCWPRHKYFTGTNPDILADEWHRWKGYKIIYKKKVNINDFDLG